jgi:hypothetical protein
MTPSGFAVSGRFRKSPGRKPPNRPPPRRVTKQLRKPNTTFAMFEKADEQTKLMEAQ